MERKELTNKIYSKINFYRLNNLYNANPLMIPITIINSQKIHCGAMLKLSVNTKESRNSKPKSKLIFILKIMNRDATKMKAEM